MVVQSKERNLCTVKTVIVMVMSPWFFSLWKPFSTVKILASHDVTAQIFSYFKPRARVLAQNTCSAQKLSKYAGIITKSKKIVQWFFLLSEGCGVQVPSGKFAKYTKVEKTNEEYRCTEPRRAHAPSTQHPSSIPQPARTDKTITLDLSLVWTS